MDPISAIGTVTTAFQAVKVIHGLWAQVRKANVYKLVDRIAKSEMEAGFRALEQAKNAPEGEAVSLLREAREHLNRAIGLESGLRLTYSHLALALCHGGLGDAVNRDKALADSLEVDPHKNMHILKAQIAVANQLGRKLPYQVEYLKHCRTCAGRINGGVKWRLTRRFVCKRCGHRTHVGCSLGGEPKTKLCRLCGDPTFARAVSPLPALL